MKELELIDIFDEMQEGYNPDHFKKYNLDINYPNWKQEFSIYLQIRKAVEAISEVEKSKNSFKENVVLASQEYEKSMINVNNSITNRNISIDKNQKKNHPLRTIFKIAASVFFVIVAGLVVSLFLQSDLSIKNSYVLRSEKKPNNTMEKLYQDKMYIEIVSTYTIEKTTELGKPEYTLKLGSAYYELGSYDEAIRVFNHVIYEEQLYVYEGYWNKAISQLKKNKPNDALLTINEALNTKQIYDNQTYVSELKKLRRTIKNPLRKIIHLLK